MSKLKPAGLEKRDTLEDCFKRADYLSKPDGSSYSGMMCGNKDLRRIVLMARELRNARSTKTLLDELQKWKTVLEERQTIIITKDTLHLVVGGVVNVSGAMVTCGPHEISKLIDGEK